MKVLMLRRCLLLGLFPMVSGARSPKADLPSENERKADSVEVAGVIGALPQALEIPNLEGLSDLFDPDVEWIENGPPAPVESLLEKFRTSGASQAVVDFREPRNLRIEVGRDFAWRTWLLDATFSAETE